MKPHSAVSSPRIT